jgi:hypothetical protein
VALGSSCVALGGSCVAQQVSKNSCNSKKN